MDHDQLGPSFGRGPAARAFQERLEQLARSSAPVLIHGESGSGKNLAANMIHRASTRGGGPYVLVSLAALAPSLIEAELFGHEEGAFTGAQRARPGRFRQAHGGTLVLDDVDGLPLEVQGKLLRVLQERVVEPLGAEAPIPIDVRVLCTSTRDLRDLVARGQFRADLYYRLAVLELEVPPLRRRAEFIPELARALIAHLASERRLTPRPLSPAAADMLAARGWPGNVRELENALERVLVCPRGAAGSAIEADEFEFLERETATAADEVAERALSSGLKLEELEAALIAAALREQRGNIAAAARQIGLSRRAFEYRLERANGKANASGEP
ncbi:MAG: sigma-54-dependent Fis family transcriptional regulator [Planctomycetes bacterium]|nr:sigma-54-dependent Fis family transcriptional regulator [Planctomycetota bacterium]